MDKIMKPTHSRRQFLQFSLSTAAVSWLPKLSKAQSKPNIVFIMADDLGYSHLGCYGQEKIKTPHIDKLASEGMRFTQCYAGAPVCAPSRSVLMTGKHCGHTSVRGNSGGLELLPEDVTVAEVLKKSGYKTGVFGKWGLGDIDTTGMPTKQGFDEFFGYLHQVHAHYYYPHFLYKNEEKYPLPGNKNGQQTQYTHDEIVKQALNFIDDSKDKPFFLYVPFTIPHTELLVPEDSFNEYDGKFPEPKPVVSQHYGDQPKPRTAFAAMVSRMDKDVGRIMTRLKQNGIDENTIVFFTSDNGGQNGGGADIEFFKGNHPLRGSKGMLYEGGIRVPMIARWPGYIKPGSSSDAVWAFDDVFPTFADIANTSTPNDIDGVSMLPVLKGETPKLQRVFHYWEHGRGRAVRLGDWKGIDPGQNKPFELYDLKNDISETTNIAEQHPKIVKQIKDIILKEHKPPRKYRKEPPAWGFKPEDTRYFK
jgi:arylsulfatase A